MPKTYEEWLAGAPEEDRRRVAEIGEQVDRLHNQWIARFRACRLEGIEPWTDVTVQELNERMNVLDCEARLIYLKENQERAESS